MSETRRWYCFVPGEPCTPDNPCDDDLCGYPIGSFVDEKCPDCGDRIGHHTAASNVGEYGTTACTVQGCGCTAQPSETVR